MSVENAINNLIKELRNHRGGSLSSGGSDKDKDKDNKKDTSGTETRERMQTSLDKEGLAANAKELFKQPFKAGLEAAMTEIREGLTLDETDIRLLLDPLRRQIIRFADFKQQTAEIFREFGDQAGNLSERFGASRLEMDKFGERSERLYGSAKTGFETFKKLSTEFGGFAALSPEFRNQIGDNVMALSKLGFSADDLSKVLDNSTRSLGMNGQEATRTIQMLGSLRQQFNIGASEITQNYILAQDRLIYSSGRVNRIFADLQSTSRRSGVEFSALVQNFGEGFDTFEGAAAKAGGLNALLGGNVFNSLELLEMDEADRLSTIVERIRGNVNVNALVTDKFNLKAIAEQLGLNPDQTRRLLLGETSVAKAMEKAIPSGAEAVKSANKDMTKALKDLRDTFDNARGPYNRALLELANSIAKGASAFGEEALKLKFSAYGTQQLQNAISETQMKLPSTKIDSPEDRTKRVSTGAAGLEFQNNLSVEKLLGEVGAENLKIITAAGLTATVPVLAQLNLLAPALGTLTLTMAALERATSENTKATKKGSPPGSIDMSE